MKYLTDNGYAWMHVVPLSIGEVVKIQFLINVPGREEPLGLENVFTTDYFESFSFDMQDAFEAAIENRIPQEEE